ncbi:MAG: lipopolysaccharide assembly protein LapA domain-containing protein [Pseudomonadota bacterium]
MRYIRYLILGAIAVALVVVSMANRGPVTLSLLPEPIAALVGFSFSITLPLFIVILGFIVVGILLGFIWEWLREHKHRAAARRAEKEAHEMKRKVRRLEGEKHEGKDEVLALLEDGGTAR